MTTSLTPLDAIIDKAAYWLRDGGGDFFVRTNEPHGIGEYVVSREQLCALHPLLPRAIEAMLTPRVGNDPTLSTRGELVRWTVDLLSKRTFNIHIEDIGLCVFHEMLGIYQREHTLDVINITGKMLTFRSMNEAGPDVPLVLCSNTVTRGFLHSTLDAAYPDWQQRLRIAQSLDLEMHEQAAYVFGDITSSTPLISVVSQTRSALTLTDVEFG